MKKIMRLCAVAAICFVGLTSLTYADAPLLTLPTPNAPAQPPQPILIPTPPTIDAKAYILMDANSGKIITQKEMDTRLPPASLTKLMTIYLTFQALQNGTIKLDTGVPVSEKAWRTGGSKMFIKVGTEVPVEQLLQGIAIQSGNDACVAISEFLAGSEDTFANMMSTQAQLLGMVNTHYMDSNGLPNPNHYTTAHDLGLLAQAIVQNFPEYYHYFGEKWFEYNGIRQPNRNRLLWRFPGADGVKTGHTDEAGFCLVASAVKGNMRLIAVILGAPSDEMRANEAVQLLTYGFRFYTTQSIYPAGTIVANPHIWYGSKTTIAAGIKHSLAVTVPQGVAQNIQLTVQLNQTLKAPIYKGQTIGTVIVKQNNDIIANQPLVAFETVEKGGWLRHLIDHFKRLFSSTQLPTITPIVKG